MAANVNIEVRPRFKTQLKDYQKALESQFARKASMGEILSALLSGTPHWQAVAMLGFYRPMDNPGSAPGSGDEPEPEPES